MEALTHKTNKLCAISPEMYCDIGKVHASKDVKIDMTTTSRSELLFIGHANM